MNELGMKFMSLEEYKIIVRGGGDLATGVIHRLWSAGFSVLVLETSNPAAIRRQVSICEAVYEGTACVEGMTAVRIADVKDAAAVMKNGQIPVLVDPSGYAIGQCHPDVVIDAIIAKKNLGTKKSMAPLTIGLGPGFYAGRDVDVVIETKRGHNLGRVIWEGAAVPNTGKPGNIGGYTTQRVIHAAHEGVLHNLCSIGNIVKEGEPIGIIVSGEDEYPVKATLSGLLRGLIRDGYPVTKGFKIADIDPRVEELDNCFTISDKARCIAGSVLEVVCASYMERLKRKVGDSV